MADSVLRLHECSAGYRSDCWPVIEGVCLEASAGAIVAIVGPNASGKTTLFRGLFRHGAWIRGEVIWRTKKVADLRSPTVALGEAAWVRQDRQFFPNFTVRQSLIAALNGGSSARDGITRVLERLPEVCPLLDRRTERLSEGQRALVNLAIGLLHEPVLLCLDEPAAGLAPTLLVRVGHVLRTYVREMGAACLIVEHRHDFLAGLADSIVQVSTALSAERRIDD